MVTWCLPDGETFTSFCWDESWAFFQFNDLAKTRPDQIIYPIVDGKSLLSKDFRTWRKLYATFSPQTSPIYDCN